MHNDPEVIRNIQVQERFHAAITGATSVEAAKAIVEQYVEEPWKALAEILAAANRLQHMPEQMGRAANGIVFYHLMRAIRKQVDAGPYLIPTETEA